jgi:hypothetical protein
MDTARLTFETNVCLVSIACRDAVDGEVRIAVEQTKEALPALPHAFDGVDP